MKADKRPVRWHGLLLIDKPGGLTSHDVVSRVRRLAGQRRVGHTGTLDPMATGLLAVLLGAATRLEPYLSGLDKTYSGRVELGLTTDTDDVTGRVVERSGGAWPEKEAVEELLRSHEGPADQIPPAFSAVKVDGRRAYKLARAGEEVELKARRVTARRLELTGWRPPFLDFVAEVSSGYYIRSLARDLGRDLGLGGALASLRRDRVGPWLVGDAHCLEEMAGWTERDWSLKLISPAEALPHLPSITLDSADRIAFGQGKKISISSPRHPGETHKILNAEGDLIGLGQIEATSFGGDSPLGPFLRPLRVLNFG